jgi:hypothetical protein
VEVRNISLARRVVLNSSRTTVTVDLPTPIVGVGDHGNKKESEKVAALSAVYQLHESGMVCYLVLTF